MIRTRSSRVGIVWLLLVAAMLLRAGVPTGWMPMVDESGFRIMLCDGSGPVELAPPAAEVTAHPRHQGTRKTTLFPPLRMSTEAAMTIPCAICVHSGWLLRRRWMSPMR